MRTPLRCGALGLAAALTIGWIAASSGQAQPKYAGRTFVVQVWGGALAEAQKVAYFQPFEAETGVKIKMVEATADSPAKLKAQVTSGNVEWDMITGWDQGTQRRLAKEGLLEKIDFAKVPGAKDLSPGTYFEYGIADQINAIVAAYSARPGVKPLTSVKDYFDVKNFPGPRGGPNFGGATMSCMMALRADDVPRDKLFPLDIDRCLKVWDRVKGSVEVWYKSGSQQQQAMMDDRVDYCMCYDGRILQARKVNPKWTYVFEGGQAESAYLGIVKGSKNVDIAQAYVQFTTDPKRQAVFVEKIGYSAPNPKLMQFLPDNLKPYLSTHPPNWAKLFNPAPEEHEIVARQSGEVERRWSEWISR